MNLPLSRYLAAERKRIREEYPDVDREGIALTLRHSRDEWFRLAQSYSRGDIVSPAVFRSFLYHCGPIETLRAFRYAGNFHDLARYAPCLGDGETA